MRTLLIEPFGGMAGDMLLAALLDLEDPRFTLEDLRALAERLVPGECELAATRVWRGSLSGRHLSVRTPETPRDAGTDPTGGNAGAPHRHYADLVHLMERAELAAPVRERAAAALWLLAEAEGRVHGCPPEEIHFHEVGAVDSLIDVCGAALALDRLGVERVRATPPLLGSGTVSCAHGEMPVPAPAVAELLRGRPAREGGGGERLTPTGAAILAAWVEAFSAPEEFRCEAIGYGAGTRDPSEGPPNVMRVRLGLEAHAPLGAAAPARSEAWLLEVNLDDMTGEEVGHLAGVLRRAGALEVWSVPVQMKKDRPGVVLSALARREARAALEAALFEHSTTLGLRWSPVERAECGRRSLEVELAGQAVRVKLRERPAYPDRSPDGERDLAPEHDDLARAAAALGWTLREARARAVAAALDALRAEGMRT